MKNSGRFVELTLLATNAVSAPIALLTFALIEPITLIVFGEKWMDTILLYRLLAIGTLFSATLAPTLGLLHALGHPNRVLAFALVTTGLTWAIGVPMIHALGIDGLGWAGLILQPAAIWMCDYGRRQTGHRILPTVLPVWLAAAGAALFGRALASWFTVDSLTALIAILTAGLLVYAAVVATLYRDRAIARRARTSKRNRQRVGSHRLNSPYSRFSPRWGINLPRFRPSAAWRKRSEPTSRRLDSRRTPWHYPRSPRRTGIPKVSANSTRSNSKPFCPDEGEHWSPVWFNVLDGDLYIALGSRAEKRVQCHENNPFITVEIGGERFDRVEADTRPGHGRTHRRRPRRQILHQLSVQVGGAPLLPAHAIGQGGIGPVSATAADPQKDKTLEGEYSTIRVERSDHVAEIVLARPEKLNAMTTGFFHEVRDATRALERAPDVRVIIVRAEGRMFTAGLDLKEAVSTLDFGESRKDGSGRRSSDATRNFALYDTIVDLQECFSVLATCRKPVIAAIHGKCIGGGVDLATACDIRVCTEDASFSIYETKIAIVADVGTLQRITPIVGKGVAREMAFTGKFLGSDRALSCGLVNEVFHDMDAMLEGARALAGEIAANSPLAVEGTKAVMNYSDEHSTDEGLEYVAQWNSSFFRTNDLMEAMQAFMEKRNSRVRRQLSLAGGRIRNGRADLTEPCRRRRLEAS